MARSIVVQTNVVTESEPDTLRVVEALNRVLVGLAFEGLTTSIQLITIDDEEENKGG